jgi:hypothetical protein
MISPVVNDERKERIPRSSFRSQFCSDVMCDFDKARWSRESDDRLPNGKAHDENGKYAHAIRYHEVSAAWNM